jgi:hypothetical protein
MTQRRALSVMLDEVADSIFGLALLPGLRATALEMTLPVEVEMVRTTGGPEFRAELPRFVTRTSFDQPTDKLTVRWVEALIP